MCSGLFLLRAQGVDAGAAWGCQCGAPGQDRSVGQRSNLHARAQSVEGEGEGHDPLVEWGLGMLGGQSEV